MTAMLNGDERFIEPTPQSLQNLTLKSVKDAVMNQFVGGNMEVSIVGDFSEEEIESCIIDYLGTVRATRDFDREQEFNPVMFRPSPSDLQFQQVFLKDTDERACAYIAGPAPNRWGFTVDGKDLFESMNGISVTADAQPNSDPQQIDSKDVQKDKQGKLRSHPLFFGITMGLLAEVINSRLFTTVRDSLGLTYDVSFELSLFDRLKLGWYVVSVTSTPGKVHKAVDACKSVLRGLHSNKVAQRELDRAKRTLLMRHETEIKSNAYWLGLLAHLQASSVPRKDVSCIKDLTSLYEAATIEDIYAAYEQLKVDEDSLYSCIGVAGAQAGEEINALEEEETDDDFQGVIPVGRGVSGYRGGMVGGRSEVSNVKTNKQVQELGRFSVKEFNRHRSLYWNGGGVGKLMFSEVVEAQKQVVSGLKYYLNIVATTQNGEKSMFDSVVVVQPGLRTTELLTFEPSAKLMVRK
ncbi:hypothetical protein NC651_032553 [Populus alba x Populus x berolinensis]|nr:hypothetical protein NC651_032553 [Populus alba x Populus x berolinensis]